MTTRERRVLLVAALRVRHVAAINRTAGLVNAAAVLVEQADTIERQVGHGLPAKLARKAKT